MDLIGGMYVIKLIKVLNNNVLSNSYVRNKLYCCNTTNIIIIDE